MMVDLSPKSNGFIHSESDLGDFSESRPQTPPESHFMGSSVAGDFEHSAYGNRRRAQTSRQLNETAAGTPSGRSCRKYHMESDIFGTGLNTNQSNQLQKRQEILNPISDPALKGMHMGAAGRPSNVKHVDWFGQQVPLNAKLQTLQIPEDSVDADDIEEENHFEEPRMYIGRGGNARENGGNPITGQGYKQDEGAHSKRRQFTKPLSAKLW